MRIQHVCCHYNQRWHDAEKQPWQTGHSIMLPSHTTAHYTTYTTPPAISGIPRAVITLYSLSTA